MPKHEHYCKSLCSKSMGLCETTNLNWVGSPTLKYSLPFDVEQKPTQCQQAYRSQKKTTLSMDTNLKVAHKTQVS